jgi:zinc transport system ATP-binding protein
MDSIVSLKNVYFSYQETKVLEDVCFEVSQGEFTGIIGPNGGGKTTLLKLLMGFLSPARGLISIFGESPLNARNEIAYVPQSLRFDRQFPISVIELVLGGRLSHLPWYGKFSPEDKQIALEALKQVGMHDFQHHSFGKLSGGQAQRVLIARALASEPRLLLLDEPTASVDPHAESEIYDILTKLQSKMTILMVTHNLQTAIELFDKVLCVNHTTALLNPQQVCEHFAFGLYHTPLLKLPTNKSEGPNS